MKQGQKINFDDFAENYREIATKGVKKISGADSSYFGEYKVKIIREDLRGRAGGGITKQHMRVLDLGCGDGLSSVFFRKYFKNVQYTGIDVSKESIRQAQKLAGRNVRFLVYDGKRIPYAENTFDVILAACVLHHVPQEEHRNLLEECRRVMKENGSTYVFEHNPVNPVTRKIVKDCVFDADAVLVKPRKLKKNLRRAGFTDVKVSYTIFFPRKGFFQKLLPLEKLLVWLPLGGQYYVKCTKSGTIGIDIYNVR